MSTLSGLLAHLAFGCASSVPVECPEKSALSAENERCEPGPINRTEDGGTPDSGTTPDASTCDDTDCDDGNECTVDGCGDEGCTNVAADEGTACVFEDGLGVCEAGACARDCEAEDCRVVYPCTEQGLRGAVEDGGDIVIGCNGPTTVPLTEGELLTMVDVRIDGQGLLTVDAEGTSRVFAVRETAQVELIGMDITGGSAVGEGAENGGAVYGVSTTEITLRDCRIYRNAASVHGGGVRTSGKLTVENCEISGNTAGQRGAGLSLFGEAQVSNTTVADNSSMDDGGGVYVNANGTATFIDSVIERNQTPGSGGGVWASGRVVLDGSIVRNNVSGDDGGAVRLWQTTSSLVTRNGTLFSNNTAAEGGAIATYAPMELSFSDTRFVGNSAYDGSGGAINNSGGSLALTDCELSGNSASNAAGAVYSYNAATVFRRTTFADNTARQGGAFRFRGTNTNRIDGLFENCTISGSAAATKGGTFLNRGAKVLLAHSTLTQSVAGGDGSGIHLIESSDFEAHASVIDVGCYLDADSVLASLGHNAVRSGDPEPCAFQAVGGHATDVPAGEGAFGLAALADNGGDSRTHMPIPGSMLIDGIPAESCLPELDHDQRGEPRNDGSACDIGAVEVQTGE